ncbi:hypothetical protein OY671_009142, partial [Metschnikowia pulcherrima]
VETRGRSRGAGVRWPCRAAARNARAGGRPVRQDSGAAQVPALGAGRMGGFARCRAPAGHGTPGSGLHAGARRPPRAAGAAGRFARGARCAAGCARAGRQRGDGRSGARRFPPDRCGRPADLQPRRGRSPVSVRQRPPGEGPPADRRGARRLCRHAGARPARGAGAVSRRAADRGRRERPPGQDRGSLSRSRAGAGDGGDRPAHGAGKRGPALRAGPFRNRDA